MNHLETIEEKVEEKEEEPLEKPIPAPKVKKPRTEKQKEAFRKARLALDEKRKRERERKAASKKPRGRPQKKPESESGEEPVPQPQKINRRIKKSSTTVCVHDVATLPSETYRFHVLSR